MTAARIPETDRAPRAAWAALWILTGINLFNYVDRYILPAVAEQIKASPIGPDDCHLGWLATAFIGVYMIAAPFFGALGDRRPRPKLLAIGVMIWSAATVMSGLAGSYGTLFAARARVGIGEAAYATIAPALLADYFPESMRGRVLSIFYAAIPIGAAIGYLLGGIVARRFTWNDAFFIGGVPGFILAVMAFRMAEAPTRTPAEKGGGIRAYLSLMRNGKYVLVVLGYAAYTFGVGGISFWMPSFLQRAHGLRVDTANIILGGMLTVTGFAGALIGGWLGDRLLSRWKEAYLWVSGWSTLLAAPFAFLAFTQPAPGYFVWLFIAEILIFINQGPINSSILGVVPKTMRASAMAFSILAIHLLGDGFSPALIGCISDTSSLDHAVLIIPVVVAVAGLIWVLTAWYGERRPRTETGASA